VEVPQAYREALDRRRTPLQQVLDVVPGSVAVWEPIRDAAGTVVDYEITAASPEAVDVTGRRGPQLVGLRVSRAYPALMGTERWDRYAEILESGDEAAVGPFVYSDTAGGVPAAARYETRIRRLGARLLVSWTALDEDAARSERLRHTERLGNLGWGEWDLRSGHAEWSEQLYRIFERDPAAGPFPLEEMNRLALPEDRPIRAAAAEAFARGGPSDSVYRIRVNGQVKHIRVVADAIRDHAGRPLKIYGIMQDVTGRETARQRLAEVERTLEEEHRLAAQLQQIILPIPDAPFNLPGLRVALRYLPAEHLSRVGGDWYHAAALPDGTVLLAIGDVAGHGIRAATTMAQVRHALRALTVTTTDPCALMSHLNRLVCDLAADLAEAVTATAVIAHFDGATGVLTWAQAGHPAPLLYRDGHTAPLDPPPGLLLGVLPEARYQAAATRIRVGDVLLFYTDGLVEHRHRSLEHGLAGVIRTLDETIGAHPHQPLSALLSRLRRANPDDDTCVLAARPLAPQDFP
jgi:serine phosphatase RsbU (regulator of sigma subunit)/PAS domain-containing protein